MEFMYSLANIMWSIDIGCVEYKKNGLENTDTHLFFIFIFWKNEVNEEEQQNHIENLPRLFFFFLNINSYVYIFIGCKEKNIALCRKWACLSLFIFNIPV